MGSNPRTEGFSIVLVRQLKQHLDGGYRKIELRDWKMDHGEAKMIWERLTSPRTNPMAYDSDYRLLNFKELQRLQAELDREHAVRRERGQKRAAAKRAKNKSVGKKPDFILCPTCEARSKKLSSEMGGLQTRRCRNGHVFEFDKFIADRIVWAPQAMGNIFKKL
jgi:hypothetical protein